MGPCGDVCPLGTTCDGEACVPNECPTFSLGIAPAGPSNYFCGAPGPIVVAAMEDVNALWGSGVQACVYGPDQPYVQNNAVSHWGTGYIYFDPNFLAMLDTGSGSLLPSASVLAHEVGHEIQGRLGVNMTSVDIELRADCYAGFFLGWVECTGMANAYDVIAALSEVCEFQTQGGAVPWWYPSDHGSCADRVNAMNNGAYFYRSGQDPLVNCGPYIPPPPPPPPNTFYCNGEYWACADPGNVAGCCVYAAQCPAAYPYFCPVQQYCTDNADGCGPGFTPCLFTGPCGP